jgi:uncharacterized protein (TIGR02270 family)
MDPLFRELHQEHLDSAAFLHAQWRAAMGSPLLSLRDVAEGVEERVLAHVDGLVLGEKPVMERVLLPALEDEGAAPEVTWAAAYALLEGGNGGLVVKALVGSGELPERAAALELALKLSSVRVDGSLRRLAAPGAPPLVAASAVRVLGTAGEELMLSPDPSLSAAAIGLCWKSPSPHAREILERALTSEVAPVRDAALRSGLLLRLRSAWDACVALVDARRPGAGLAMQALAMGGSAAHVDLLGSCLDDEALRPEALFALGFSGRPRAVEACLPWLADKDLGPLAGEVFSVVTGAAIDGPLKAGRKEEEDAAEAGLDEDLSGDPEEDLPPPEPEAVKALWEQRKGQLRPEGRFLGGEPLSAARLTSALANGPTRRRPMLALELAIRTDSAPAETMDWARRQLAAPPAVSKRFEDRPFEAFFGR